MSAVTNYVKDSLQDCIFKDFPRSDLRAKYLPTIWWLPNIFSIVRRDQDNQ